MNKTEKRIRKQYFKIEKSYLDDRADSAFLNLIRKFIDDVDGDDLEYYVGRDIKTGYQWASLSDDFKDKNSKASEIFLSYLAQGLKAAALASAQEHPDDSVD